MNLKGKEIAQVNFVQDYYELGFDGPVLRILGRSKLKTSETEYNFPESGIRDALCTLIGRVVKQQDFREGIFLRLVFEGDTVLEIDLRENKEFPEVMHFIPGENESISVF